MTHQVRVQNCAAQKQIIVAHPLNPAAFSGCCAFGSGHERFRRTVMYAGDCTMGAMNADICFAPKQTGAAAPLCAGNYEGEFATNVQP